MQLKPKVDLFKGLQLSGHLCLFCRWLVVTEHSCHIYQVWGGKVDWSFCRSCASWGTFVCHDNFARHLQQRRTSSVKLANVQTGKESSEQITQRKYTWQGDPYRHDGECFVLAARCDVMQEATTLAIKSQKQPPMQTAVTNNAAAPSFT